MQNSRSQRVPTALESHSHLIGFGITSTRGVSRYTISLGTTTLFTKLLGASGLGGYPCWVKGRVEYCVSSLVCFVCLFPYVCSPVLLYDVFCYSSIHVYVVRRWSNDHNEPLTSTNNTSINMTGIWHPNPSSSINMTGIRHPSSSSSTNNRQCQLGL